MGSDDGKTAARTTNPSEVDEENPAVSVGGQEARMAEQNWVKTASTVLTLVTQIIVIIGALAVFSGWLADQFANSVNTQIGRELQKPDSELGRLRTSFSDLNETLGTLTEQIGNPGRGLPDETIYAQLEQLSKDVGAIQPGVPRSEIVELTGKIDLLENAVSGMGSTNALLNVQFQSMRMALDEHTHAARE